MGLSRPLLTPDGADSAGVRRIFDDITYQKGSSVLCMIANMVRPPSSASFRSSEF